MMLNYQVLDSNSCIHFGKSEMKFLYLESRGMMLNVYIAINLSKDFNARKKLFMDFSMIKMIFFSTKSDYMTIQMKL